MLNAYPLGEPPPAPAPAATATPHGGWDGEEGHVRQHTHTKGRGRGKERATRGGAKGLRLSCRCRGFFCFHEGWGSGGAHCARRRGDRLGGADGRGGRAGRSLRARKGGTGRGGRQPVEAAGAESAGGSARAWRKEDVPGGGLVQPMPPKSREGGTVVRRVAQRAECAGSKKDCAAQLLRGERGGDGAA